MNFDEQVKAGKEFVSATWMPSKRSSKEFGYQWLERDEKGLDTLTCALKVTHGKQFIVVRFSLEDLSDAAFEHNMEARDTIHQELMEGICRLVGSASF